MASRLIQRNKLAQRLPVAEAGHALAVQAVFHACSGDPFDKHDFDRFDDCLLPKAVALAVEILPASVHVPRGILHLHRANVVLDSLLTFALLQNHYPISKSVFSASSAVAGSGGRAAFQ